MGKRLFIAVDIDEATRVQVGRISNAVREAIEANTSSGPNPLRPISRWPRFRDRVSRANIAEIAHIPASAGPSRIDRVTLYESRLSPAGQTYVPLAEAPLQP